MSTPTCPRTNSRKYLSWLILLISISVVTTAWLYAAQCREENIVQYHRIAVMSDLLAADNTALIILSPDDKVVEWSPGATKLFGWEPQEILGSSIDFLIPKWEMGQRYKQLADVTPTTAHIVAFDTWRVHKDGHLVPVHLIISAFRDHVSFYRIEFATSPGDFKTLASVPKPAAHPEPQPHPVPERPGIHSPHNG